MTTWLYIRKGMVRDETVGPIDTETLARRIANGEIEPDTMISSQDKTHGQWVPMRAFDKLAVIYERGRDQRAEAKAQAQAAKAEQKQLAKQAKAEQQRDRRRELAERAPARPIQVLEPAAPVSPQAAQAAPAMAPAFYAAPAQGPTHVSHSTSTNVTVNLNRPFRHLLHFVLTIMTCGFWLPIWIVARLLHRG